MLYLDNPQDIAGVTVYPDSQLDYVFYLVPPYPRFRRDAQGKPVFQLLKFRRRRPGRCPRSKPSRKKKEAPTPARRRRTDRRWRGRGRLSQL